MGPGDFVCGLDGPARLVGRKLQVEILPYTCPWCVEGRWESGERCLHCMGLGQTDDPSPGCDAAGNTVVPERLPRPPGVMRQPCVDCAYRPGSYERQNGTPLPDASAVFFCHHGLGREGNGYRAPVMVEGLPVGAMVCGGWWSQFVDGQPAPQEEFRDPGGSDRSAAAPSDVEA